MPSRTPTETLAPILYSRSPDLAPPDTDEIVRAGLAGHPIELRQDEDFTSLFHAMDRLGIFGAYRLIRKKMSAGRWLVYILPVGEYRILLKSIRQNRGR